MGLFDFLKPKKQKPVVVKKTTTVVNKHTTVVKKEEKKEEKLLFQQVETKLKKQYPNLIVVLDPGHASSTHGKRSPYSTCKVQPALDFYEYKFNREICTMISQLLPAYGIEVYITTDEQRDKDVDVSLTTRATRAWNVIKASGKKGIFISVHANANGKGTAWDSARGWSVYTTKGNNISDKLADCFYDEAEKLYKNTKMKIRTDKSDSDRDWEENFTVIYKTEQFSIKNGKVTVPAVLTENFFYSNIDDCKYLCDFNNKVDIAQLHLNAILAFADKEFKM